MGKSCYEGMTSIEEIVSSWYDFRQTYNEKNELNSLSIWHEFSVKNKTEVVQTWHDFIKKNSTEVMSCWHDQFQSYFLHWYDFKFSLKSC